MAVYKRKYNPYTGSLTPEQSRFFVLTRYAFADLFKSRAFVLLLILALVPTLFYAGYIFLANNTMAQMLLRTHGNGFGVDTEFFMILVIVQTQVAFLLNCWVGPVLISGDLTNGALPLFLSRPFSRPEYVLGKLAVLALLLSAVTWIPSASFPSGISRRPISGRRFSPAATASGGILPAPATSFAKASRRAGPISLPRSSRIPV